MDLIIALVIVLIIVVIWRGPKTIPEIGRMFGQGIREARAEATKIRSGDEASADGAPKDDAASKGGSSTG